MRINLTLFFSFLFVYVSFAQFTVEQALSSPFPTNLTAAPTQEKVAWVINEKGVRNIWLATGKDWTAQAITTFAKDDGQAISNLIFKENTSEILFVRGGAPNRRGEIPNPTSHADGAKRFLFKISEKGGALDTLEEGSNPVLSPNGQTLAFIKDGQVWLYDFANKKAKKAFTIRGRAGQLSWSPNNQQLAFVSNRGDHSFIGIYEVDQHELNYLSPSVDNDNSPVWSPDGTAIAFTRIPSKKDLLPFMPRRSTLPWSIMVHNFNKGKTMEVWKAPKGQGSAFRFISGANQLFWMADNHLVFPYEGDGWTHLWAISLNGGKAKNLTPGNFEVQFVAQDPAKKTLLFSANKNDIDRQHIWRVVPSTGAATNITLNKGVQWTPVATAENQLFCLASTGTQPAHIAKIDGSKIEPLTQLKYLENQITPPEQVVFSSADGMAIHGQLFKPKNWKNGKKYPAALFFHGGSRRQMLLGFHHSGYYHNAFAFNQYLANQGYIVMSVNYRSGIGYGMKFREALNYGARGASEYLDVMGAGLYMRNRADVDPAKIGLWGGSYGGYLTALGLAKSSDLFAAGVDIHGVHDWNQVIKNFVPNYQPEKAKETAELAYQSSPMPYVKDWRSPVLLIHGDDDRNVPFSETVEIAETLRKHEVYFEQLIFPDEVHGFLLHKNWVATFEASADFFNRMLKDKE